MPLTGRLYLTMRLRADQAPDHDRVEHIGRGFQADQNTQAGDFWKPAKKCRKTAQYPVKYGANAATSSQSEQITPGGLTNCSKSDTRGGGKWRICVKLAAFTGRLARHGAKRRAARPFWADQTPPPIPIAYESRDPND
ncbi:MAG: hypothetical protein COC12_08020 [Rhodobacteraceae bacterium]|nr:MAG: hypothetical protein COC12_08020 [Paracoccaceae bacterium]